MAAMQTPNVIRNSFFESVSRIPLLNSQLIIYPHCGTEVGDNNVPAAQRPNAAGAFCVETAEWKDWDLQKAIDERKDFDKYSETDDILNQTRFILQA